MIKKIVSITLAIFVMINFCSMTKAIDVSDEIEPRFFSDGFGDYYEDESLFIVIQKNKNRSIVVAANFKDINVVKEYVGNDIIDSVYGIVNKIKKNEFYWTNEYKNNESNVRLRSGWQEADVRDKLERAYGNEYYDRYIHGKNMNGVTGSVYEDKQFEIIYDSAKYLRAGMKIATILATLGVPGFNIKGIISVVMSANDIYVLAKDVKVDTYFANVNYNREARVNGRTYDTAGRTIYGKVVFGDLDSTYNRGRTTTSGYFDDTTRMIETAVYIYNTRN